MLRDASFDFAKFDAEAAELDLEVETTEVLERAIVAPASAVASAIEPGARRGGERIGNEAFGSELGAVPVADGDAFAADAQFTRDADGA